jgi:hypothetical protein
MTLWGCDSNSADQDLGTLAGEYALQQFRFVPDSPLLEPVNMLDTLVVGATKLQLFSSGRFTLLYQFEGGKSTFVGGDATATSGGVKLKGDRNDEAVYGGLLLPIEFQLKSGTAGGTLNATLERRVNLSAFSDRYQGLPSVEGKLILALKRG